jgi:hypothetical protein
MNELISELLDNAYGEVNINEVEVEIIEEFETAK